MKLVFWIGIFVIGVFQFGPMHKCFVQSSIHKGSVIISDYFSFRRSMDIKFVHENVSIFEGILFFFPVRERVAVAVRYSAPAANWD